MGNLKYQLEQLPEDKSTIRLLNVTFSKYEDDWPSLMHSHFFTELFYVKDGSGEFHVDGTSFPIRKDDLVIINPDNPHTEVSSSSSPLEYFSLGVEGLRFTFANEQESMVFHCVEQKNNLLFYFTSMLHELEQKQDGYQEICKDMLDILIIQLHRITNSAFEVKVSQRPNRECEKIKRYIDSNYQDNITLDTLAQMAHLNKYYFVHTFTKCYGMSPINYLNEKRIEVSKELLASTDHCIADVAQLSGFASQSYFSQSFKKSCGVTAGVYRKMSRKMPSRTKSDANT
jgi:AraC-like DNA-binding protein/mannose-6-phosphate isomerase-like protein (cupin superfamily)